MTKKKLNSVLMAACMLGALAACGDDSDSGKKDDDSTQDEDGSAQPDESGDDESDGEEAARYLIGTATLGDDSSGYGKIVDSLDLKGKALTIDDTWEEFTGLSDAWARDGFVFVAPGTSPEVIKHSVDKNNKLVEVDKISFMNFGVTSTAFWNNTFVSKTKAYMARGAAGVVAWNPDSMEIGKEIAFDLEKRAGGLQPAVGLADRASTVVNGKVYLAAYWTDMNYAERSDDSVILVIDSASDKLVDRIKVDCAALDYATLDDDGNIWFSNWTGGAGTFYVLDTPETCIAKLDPKTGKVTTQTFSEITGGHQGAAFAYVGNGKFVMSVFDEVAAKADSASDFRAVVAGTVWNVWGYDPKTGKAAPVAGYEANSGAVYHTKIDDSYYSMVTGADYANTNVYRLDGITRAEKAYSVNGWSLRLFKLD